MRKALCLKDLQNLDIYDEVGILNWNLRHISDIRSDSSRYGRSKKKSRSAIRRTDFIRKYSPEIEKKIKFNSMHHPGVEPGSRAWKAHILTVGLMERAHTLFQITSKYTNVLLLLKHKCFIRDFCKLQCPEGLKGLNILNLNSNLHSHH